MPPDARTPRRSAGAFKSEARAAVPRNRPIGIQRSRRRAASIESLLQRRLLLVRERALDHVAAELRGLRHHLVARRLADEHQHRGAALGQLVAELPHEVVVDAVVAQRAGRSARRRTDRHAEERHQEDEADEATPRRPFFTVAYFIFEAVRPDDNGSGGGSSSATIDIVVLVLLVYVFLKRKKSEPPKWMGRLQTATPKFALVLGLLLLGVFPTDIITSVTVGARLANEGSPWVDGLPFIVLTLLLLALPVILVILLGNRAKVFLPKARDWMNTNSWIVNEIVIVFFIVITINSLAG